MPHGQTSQSRVSMSNANSCLRGCFCFHRVCFCRRHYCDSPHLPRLASHNSSTVLIMLINVFRCRHLITFMTHVTQGDAQHTCILLPALIHIIDNLCKDDLDAWIWSCTGESSTTEICFRAAVPARRSGLLSCDSYEAAAAVAANLSV